MLPTRARARPRRTPSGLAVLVALGLLFTVPACGSNAEPIDEASGPTSTATATPEEAEGSAGGDSPDPMLPEEGEMPSGEAGEGPDGADEVAASGDAPPDDGTAQRGGDAEEFDDFEDFDSDTPPELPESTGVDIAVEFERDCATPGNEQTMTVATEPGLTIQYEAIYSDGKQSFDQGHHGGSGFGTADEHGRWSDTWQIAPTAPPGEVKVHIYARRDQEVAGYRQARFTMAAAAGQCV